MTGAISCADRIPSVAKDDSDWTEHAAMITGHYSSITVQRCEKPIWLKHTHAQLG